MLLPQVGDRVWSLRVEDTTYFVDWKFVVNGVREDEGVIVLKMDPSFGPKEEYNIYPGWSFVWTTDLQRMIREKY